MSAAVTTDDGDSIACPHCGHAMRDLDDHAWRTANGSVRVRCERCRKPIDLRRHEHVSYTATAVQS